MNKIPVTIRNIIILAVLSLIESVHLLFPIVLGLNYVAPLKYDAAVWNKYFPFLQSAIKPNRDFLFYHWWLFLAMAIHGVLLWYFRKDLQEEGLPQRLRAYILNEAFFLFALLFCSFKIITWASPGWAWDLLYVFLILSWVVRIFWPEIIKAINRLQPWVKGMQIPAWGDGLIIIGILALILPTDIESVLARVFIQERFHHFDGVIMAPGWAYLCGLTLNVDVICQYGVGMTIAVTKLAQLMGGFSYSHVLWVYVIATCIYFSGAYILLRFWLGSVLIAVGGVLLAVKFQMFHWGVAPIIWEFLSVTVVRYFFDIFFLFFILHHLRYRSWGLWAACICSGISLAYMPDTGLYQWIAFLVYLFFNWMEDRKAIVAVYAVAPLLLGGIIFGLLMGSALWNPQFWQGASEQASLFLNGLGDLPIYQNLSEGNFFAFFMGLFIPLAYVFTMIFTGAEYFLEPRRRENIFVVVLCTYGLGLYHYFICRSALTSYHAVDIPFVFILCYWVRRVHVGRLLRALMVILILGSLMTNYFFTYYPNVFNICRYDWAKEKAFYRQQFDFAEDANLIDRLTQAQDRVPVISSSEVKILMQANRKPFFYYFPLIYPNFMNTNAFTGTYLYTKERVMRTLNQLHQEAPEYIFVEAIFYRGQLSQDIYQKNAGLTVLMNYLHNYYEEAAEGKYLLALKKKAI